MWGADQYDASFSLRHKFFKRINRYSMLQISFVYALSMCTSGYNLYYTWYGRQIFWIDIEGLVLNSMMCAVLIVAIFTRE